MNSCYKSLISTGGQSFTGICPTLSAPRNGDVNVSDYFVGGTANFACNERFGMIGSGQIICEADGLWSQQPPVCNRKIVSSFFV